MNIGIYIYKNAEVLDFSGPFEVFSTANRFSGSKQKFNVFLIAETRGTISARGEYNINPHYGFDNHPPIDLLIVVGGIHTEELEKPAVINWVTETAEDAQIVASVCTGAFILAKAGLLSGVKVTTHWQDVNELQRSFPELSVLTSQRWVDEGRIISSGGISAGIDMSLHLVSKLTSMTLAEKTARQMEYDWHKNPYKEN